MAFSPNDDGIRDVLWIHIEELSEGLQNPLHWDCAILDSRGNRVRFWKADKRLRRAAPALWNFFAPSDRDLEPIHLFDRLLWDGRNDAGDALPDGRYSLRIRIVDRKSSRIFSKTLDGIIIDTSPPELALEPVKAQLLLSSGSDLSSEEFRLKQIARKAETGSYFKGQLFDDSGRLLSERHWQGHLPNQARIRWKDLRWKKETPTTRYRYRLIARDPAGNTAHTEYRDLLLSDFSRRFLLRSAHPRFSPNNDGILDQTGLELIAIDPRGVPRKSSQRVQLLVQIMSAKKDRVYLETPLAGKLPLKFWWNGKDANGERLADGKYYARVLIGGRSIAEDLPIYIDTEPPALDLSLRKEDFTPDGDGRRDSMSFALRLDENEIQDWQIGIYLQADVQVDAKHPAPYQTLYRHYKGDLSPHRFFWNGRSSDGHRAESYESFFVVAEVRDRAGNVGRTSSAIFQTGLLLRPFAPGEKKLLARIPLQGYFDADGNLTKKGRALLDSIKGELKDYGLYRYSFETHSSAQGREEKNLYKTERQALSVERYLRKKDWWPQRKYTVRGFGETELIYEDNQPFTHYRNARLELRLFPN